MLSATPSLKERDPRIVVQVAYAGLSGQWTLAAVLASGQATVADALHASGILTIFPSWQQDQLALGIYGSPAKLGDAVCSGDRIEIYDPLQIDPKQARQLKVQAQRRRQRASVQRRRVALKDGAGR